MTLNYDKVLFTSVKTRSKFDALYHGKGFQPPLTHEYLSKTNKMADGIARDELTKLRLKVLEQVSET